MLRKINTQLKQRKLIVKNEKAKADVLLTESPFLPTGTPAYEVVEDRKEERRTKQDMEKEGDYHRLKEVEDQLGIRSPRSPGLT